jgi:hypothetical protein
MLKGYLPYVRYAWNVEVFFFMELVYFEKKYSNNPYFLVTDEQFSSNIFAYHHWFVHGQQQDLFSGNSWRYV